MGNKWEGKTRNEKKIEKAEKNLKETMGKLSKAFKSGLIESN